MLNGVLNLQFNCLMLNTFLLLWVQTFYRINENYADLSYHLVVLNKWNLYFNSNFNWIGDAILLCVIFVNECALFFFTHFVTRYSLLNIHYKYNSVFWIMYTVHTFNACRHVKSISIDKQTPNKYNNGFRFLMIYSQSIQIIPVTL